MLIAQLFTHILKKQFIQFVWALDLYIHIKVPHENSYAIMDM